MGASVTADVTFVNKEEEAFHCSFLNTSNNGKEASASLPGFVTVRVGESMRNLLDLPEERKVLVRGLKSVRGAHESTDIAKFNDGSVVLFTYAHGRMRNLLDLPEERKVLVRGLKSVRGAHESTDIAKFNDGSVVLFTYAHGRVVSVVTLDGSYSPVGYIVRQGMTGVSLETVAGVVGALKRRNAGELRNGVSRTFDTIGDDDFVYASGVFPERGRALTAREFVGALKRRNAGELRNGVSRTFDTIGDDDFVYASGVFPERGRALTARELEDRADTKDNSLLAAARRIGAANQLKAYRLFLGR